MEPMAVMVITLVLFFLFLAAGIPIAFSLAFSGLIGVFLSGGMLMLQAVGYVPFGQARSYSLLAVPMFILMGNILLHHEVGADLYDTTYKWLGWMPGGLAVASVGFCALFGFMCGSTAAAAATIGGVAIPEMEKRGYERRFALGTLAVSGTLASLIPPSTIMIIYCVVSEASMGDLFVAGIFPGLLLAALIAAFVLFRVWVNPKLGPPGDRFPWRMRLTSLVHLIPVVILFITIIGGIYMGIWSAIEAGAAGVFVSILLCLGYRRLNWSNVKTSLIDTLRVSIMIYMLVIGANIFAYVFYLTGVQRIIQDFVLGLTMPGWAIILIMGCMLMVLGTFMEVIALMLITVPIFLPIVTAIGYSDIWFGIMMVIFSEMAQITPPVGVSLFVILGIAPKGTSLWDVGLGAAPYILVLWICLSLLIVFPDIALWLPSTMRF